MNFIYCDKISVYLQRHPRAGEDTHLTSTVSYLKHRIPRIVLTIHLLFPPFVINMLTLYPGIPVLG